MNNLTPQTPSPFAQLQKKLWIGTLAIHFSLLLGFALFNPARLYYCAAGVGLGIFYLWSLTFNAENPKKGIQFAFSVIRMAGFAYAAVQLAHAQPTELAIVMSGLLSYKVVLTVEYVVQALPAFRRLAPAKAGRRLS
ncbi:hypothetical protein [Vampirovibrio sp.]|uniref:hypothetical protein n=1 Tax=Vampirovibrio sp. TaxID=2717857 RepID=UPI0035947F43